MVSELNSFDLLMMVNAWLATQVFLVTATRWAWVTQNAPVGSRVGLAVDGSMRSVAPAVRFDTEYS